MTVRALLGFGSNLGNRVGQIQQAIAQLTIHPSIEVLETSRFYETTPVDMAEPDVSRFINAVIMIDTDLSPQDLLQTCLEIEQQLGRNRFHTILTRVSDHKPGYASRTLDIDILFYDSQVIRERNLEIPHPRLHQRAFILVPLMDIAPDWLHPQFNKTIRELCAEQPDHSECIPLTLPACP
jgi:2-amino-4-hydroxy-6-hydroxymethyldihydropteridine diphosphokinase